MNGLFVCVCTVQTVRVRLLLMHVHGTDGIGKLAICAAGWSNTLWYPVEF